MITHDELKKVFACGNCQEYFDEPIPFHIQGGEQDALGYTYYDVLLCPVCHRDDIVEEWIPNTENQ